jgi:hypothetical protein
MNKINVAGEESMSNQQFGQQPSKRSRNTGKQADAARISGSESAPTQLSKTSSTVTSQVQGVLDEQVARGARMMSSVAQSTRRAAAELDADAPQIAGLVRGVADRVEEYSRNLENQSLTDLYVAATDFTRRQPAVVFGMAALAGFFALRTFKSSQTSSATGRRTGSSREEFHGS